MSRLRCPYSAAAWTRPRAFFAASLRSPADPRPPSNPADAAPLHACLATAAVGDGAGAPAGDPAALAPGGSQLVSPSVATDDARPSGELFAVGRKNCDATLDDKCVSRRHATIALLSRHPPPDPAAAARPEDPDGRTRMECGAPATPEEVAACASSPSGVICAVRDLGSKFGTYVSVDEALWREHRPPRAGVGEGDEGGGAGEDGDETGDETEDEAAAAAAEVDYAVLTEKQARAVRLLSSADDDAPLPKFRKLAAKSSMVLLPLSHARPGNRSSPGDAPHVILLFGPQGSAVRLSLVPLRFTFSRLKKAELDPLLGALPYVGAAHAAQWDVDASTHLVAPERTAAAKGIMAYACRRPVVTQGFVEALAARTRPGDPLPREADFW